MSRILVVDDDKSFREMLRETLEQAGHEVEEAANGKLALELHRRKPCQMVITDLIMPVKEGIETIVELRRLDPSVKIIAMSGGGVTKPGNNLAIAEKLGASMTLTKPFMQEELLKAVSKVLAT